MNDDFCAFTDLAVNFYRAIVFVNDFLYIAETQPESFYIMGIACRHTVEFLKNVFLVFPGDANTVIRNSDGYTLAVSSGGNGDLRYPRGIFESVVNEVDKNIEEIGLIDEHHRISCVKEGGNHSAAAVNLQFECINSSENHLMNIRSVLIQLNPGLFKYCSLKHLFNKDPQ